MGLDPLTPTGNMIVFVYFHMKYDVKMLIIMVSNQLCFDVISDDNYCINC